MMAASGLFSSCATPASVVPMLAIRSLRRSSSSWRCRSVTSSTIPSYATTLPPASSTDRTDNFTVIALPSRRFQRVSIQFGNAGVIGLNRSRSRSAASR